MGYLGPLEFQNSRTYGHENALNRRARTAFEVSAERNAGHSRACTEIMQPGGACRSEYNGASQALSSRLRLVAQMSKLRNCSRSLRFTLPDFNSMRSCCISFMVFTGGSSIVSRLKFMFHPHRVKESWRCTFFQEIGADIAQKTQQ